MKELTDYTNEDFDEMKQEKDDVQSTIINYLAPV